MSSVSHGVSYIRLPNEHAQGEGLSSVALSETQTLFDFHMKGQMCIWRKKKRSFLLFRIDVVWPCGSFDMKLV